MKRILFNGKVLLMLAVASSLFLSANLTAASGLTGKGHNEILKPKNLHNEVSKEQSPIFDVLYPLEKGDFIGNYSFEINSASQGNGIESLMQLRNNYIKGYSIENSSNTGVALPLSGDSADEDGCLTAEYGQFPEEVVVPSCVGVPQEVTLFEFGSASEFTMLSLTADVEYILSSSIETDYITISDEEGTEVIMAGFTPLTYTPAADETVRFYTHADENCGDDEDFRGRYIQCGEPVVIEEPDYECFQGDGLVDEIYDGYPVTIGGGSRIADDFIVEEETTFTIHQITLDVLSVAEVDNAIINIRENNDGVPGEVIETVTMVPSESVVYGDLFGFAAFHLTFDLEEPLMFPEGTYWLQPFLSNIENDVVYWQVTDTGSNGALARKSINEGAWEEMDEQAVFFVAGDCEELGVIDVSSFDFTYYPNPAKDVLHISAKREVENVSVFNLLGQKVLNNAKISQNQVDLRSLPAGNYIFRVALKGGQIETFKVIKK